MQGRCNQTVVTMTELRLLTCPNSFGYRHLTTDNRRWPFILWLALVCLFAASCVANSRSFTSFGLEQKQVSSGILTEDTREDGLEQMAQAGGSEEDKSRLLAKAAVLKESGLREGSDVFVSAAGNASDSEIQLPADSGKLVPLLRMSPMEVDELTQALILKLQTENGYRPASEAEQHLLPRAPEGVSGPAVLARVAQDQTALLRLGHQRFRSQAPQFWVQGVMIGKDSKTLSRNADVDLVATNVTALIASMAELRKQLTVGDLAFKIIPLSHIDLKGAITNLKGFGFTTLEDPSKIPTPIPFQQLPIIAAMPSPTEAQTALLGEHTLAKGAFDISITPAVATKLPYEANTAPGSQLLVYFHPAHPEQFSRVKQVLDDYIDRPDRQIFVEGLVLEISSEGLEELGVEWQFKEGNFDAVVGSIANPSDTLRTTSLTFDDLKNFDKNWVVKLHALVRDGKAEILSRPTVLTLNNRQATIRVGTDIPIATSQEQGTTTSANKIAFDFKYLATGISLNIRPRIAEGGDQISLMIDTIVSAVVPGADLELKSSSGDVLAAAPTVSTRRVQTYARINNNTPFIIGGLVSKEHSMKRSKVPLLGDIPYLGVFFRSKRDISTKREVIIVLTPRVLEEETPNELGIYMPKDEDRFDQFGNTLFRDSYRIRAEDVFDLSFLRENQTMQRAHHAAEAAIKADFSLAQQYPFNAVADGRLPGERVMVHRMIYEVVKRLSPEKGKRRLDHQVDLNRLIILAKKHEAGFDVEFLERILSVRGDGRSSQSFFTNNPGQALLIAFEGDDTATLAGTMQRSHLPKISMIPCESRAEWGQLLWKLNQPDAAGQSHSAILIQSPNDLLRLRRAVMLRKIILLNGGREQMTTRNFSLGKVLLMPEAKPEQTHVIDAEVARYFMETEHYYAAALQEIDRVTEALNQELQRRGLIRLESQRSEP